MKKAIIFDLFGTLVSSTDPEAKIIKRFSLSPRDYDNIEQAVCGYSKGLLEDYLTRIIKVAKISNNLENKKILKEIIDNERSSTILIPGAIEILNNLKNGGYTLSIISNAYNRSKEILENTGLIKLFDEKALFLSDETGLLKPYKETYINCFKQLNVEAKNVIMIGDSIRDDIQGPKKATDGKIKTILISTTTKDCPEADYIIPTFRELPKTINKIR